MRTKDEIIDKELNDIMEHLAQINDPERGRKFIRLSLEMVYTEASFNGYAEASSKWRDSVSDIYRRVAK
jgi:metal-sulfur cluster biosynthetic enzyme